MLTWWEQDTELRTLNYVWLLLQTKRKEFILKWNLFNENYWGGGHLYHHTHVGIREQFIFYYKYFESPSIYCNSKWLVYHCIVGWIMSPKRYAEVTGHGICKWTLFGNIWAFENVLSWYHSGLGWSQIKDWCLSRPREGPYIPGRVICKDWVLRSQRTKEAYCPIPSEKAWPFLYLGFELWVLISEENNKLPLFQAS